MTSKIFNDNKRLHGIDAGVFFWCRATDAVAIDSPAFVAIIGGIYLLVRIVY
jgi:hypothetical protein